MAISAKKPIGMGYAFMDFALRTTTSEAIAAYRFDKRPSGVAEELLGEGMNATFTSVDFPYGVRGPSGLAVPYFDGSAGLIDLYSSALNSAFTPALFSISIWAKVYEEAVWTNSTKQVIFRLGADSSNFVEVSKTTTTDQLKFEYKAGGTSDTVTYTLAHDTGETPLDWIHLALSIDAASNSMIGYVKGISEGTAASLGTWSGSLNSDLCLVGGSAVGTPADQYYGYISDLIIYGDVLTSEEILRLAKKR